MTSNDQVTAILKDNLYNIFGEGDVNKRLSKLALLWASSADSVFVDSEGFYRGHEAISKVVDGILEKADPGFVFTELSKVEVLPSDPTGDVRVAKLKWGHGPQGKEPLLRGEDIAIVVNGKIKTMYTFLELS